VRVQPEVVFPWQEAHFLATVGGDSAGPVHKPEPLDIAFLVDVSGSMTKSIPTMANAVREMARQLMAVKGDTVRFALVRFDTEAETLVPWTNDASALDKGLKRLEAITGDNDPREIFARMHDLSAGARRDAKRVMVFYTDGEIATQCPWHVPLLCSDRNMSYGEAAAAAGPLRNDGIELFCVGNPGQPVHPVMLEITGSSDRIFLPADIHDLASNFAALTDAVARVRQVGTQLSHPIDGLNFRTPLGETSWTREPSGSLRLDIGRLPHEPVTFGHPIVPLHAGVWRVGAAPTRLTYADADGRVIETAADLRPRMLVLTWAALLLPFLPWLVWLLFQSVPEQPRAEIESPPLPVRVPPLPSTLPPLPEGEAVAAPLPTLFIGLGGAGLEALYAIRADLEQLHLGSRMDAYRFLALDVDQRDPAPSKFASLSGGEMPRLIPPREIVQLRDFVPRPGEAAQHLQWFDAIQYEHAAREEVNLADGSKGDRMLARLALFRWLATPQPPVLETLAREIDALMQTRAADPLAPSQVVVVASPCGGTGSGWFVDTLRLVRRRLRARQRGSEVLPEIVGILVSTDAADPVSVANRTALIGELESIALTGQFPRRTTMVPDDSLLDRTDTESPFDWLLETGDTDRHSAAAQSGALAALLCQQDVRTALLESVMTQDRVPVQVATTGVHVHSTMARDQVQLDVLLRLLGPDVLLDIEAIRGGYSPRQIADAEVQKALDAWIRSEPPRTPLRQLLEGQVVAEDHLLLHALRMSINQQLRPWQPTLAAAALQSFVSRHPESSAAARFASSVASDLKRWGNELAAFAKDAADQQRSVAARLAFARSLRRRAYVDSLIDDAAVEQASRASLERWLGTRNTLAPLRERLFFSAEADGTVVLRSHIAAPVILRSPSEAAESLSGIARALAATVPSVRLSTVFALMTEKDRGTLAASLLASGVRADSVILAAPSDAGDFRRTVGQPASDGVRRDCVADDGSSVRRVSLAATPSAEIAVAKPPYVEGAERESDRIRFRIADRFRIRVPLLPPQLRVATAQPSRFRSFARAYQTGGIVRRADENGVTRWYTLDGREFLGAEAHRALADAAANFVYSDIPSADPNASRPPGDFTALDEGIANGGNLTEEGLVQAAIRVAAES
jgi:hypothetical protein